MNADLSDHILAQLPDSFWVLTVITVAVIGVGLFDLISKRPIGVSKTRALGLVGLLVVCWAVFLYKFFDDRSEAKTFVGRYDLENYHGCVSCVLDLKADLTYTIDSGDVSTVFESGEWHYMVSEDDANAMLADGRFLGRNSLKFKQ